MGQAMPLSNSIAWAFPVNNWRLNGQPVGAPQTTNEFAPTKSRGCGNLRACAAGVLTARIAG